uniref:Sorting nexin 7 n=1 Tax=Molossus molossus TaxID=27622 RepID=A0A7J8CU68_MOLMO|nr:sorting nexin 7 [Molossus molossus]
MEGELSAAPRRSSGLPDGGAGGDGGDSPSALLPAEALDLDGDEDDLEVFSKDASLMDMNSLSPLMPTSPLSMINQVKFEDEPDLKDLFITVDEPESHVTTIETFITYRIITKPFRGRESDRGKEEGAPALGPALPQLARLLGPLRAPDSDGHRATVPGLHYIFLWFYVHLKC